LSIHQDNADFGGEVERILRWSTALSCWSTAPIKAMPQTKFVTGARWRWALFHVVANKIDRTDGRASEVLDEVFDLLRTLGASDEQLDSVLWRIGPHVCTHRKISKARRHADPAVRRSSSMSRRPQHFDGPFKFSGHIA
jgi:GTP-binding protein